MVFEGSREVDIPALGRRLAGVPDPEDPALRFMVGQLGLYKVARGLCLVRTGARVVPAAVGFSPGCLVSCVRGSCRPLGLFLRFYVINGRLDLSS